MTGVTHIAIACSMGIAAGCGKPDLLLLAGGALLPDIDHSRSIIGRIFFPISIPLHKYFGHRGPIHSFWLWSIPCIIGIWWPPALMIGAGAQMHIFADCATLSGVRAFAPWSTKLFVCFRRDWRIRSGGPAELIVLMFFGSIAWAGGYMGAMGGIGAVLGHLTGAPKIMVEEYRAKGLQECFVEGKLRWNNGSIEEGRWLIIGSEGKGLAIQGDNKLFHIPGDAYFQKARLKPTPDRRWELIRLRGWARTETDCYFLDGHKWHFAPAGEVVWGSILGHNLTLDNNI